jgi:hypothetical protein
MTSYFGTNPHTVTYTAFECPSLLCSQRELEWTVACHRRFLLGGLTCHTAIEAMLSPGTGQEEQIGKI